MPKGAYKFHTVDKCLPNQSFASISLNNNLILKMDCAHFILCTSNSLQNDLLNFFVTLKRVKLWSIRCIIKAIEEHFLDTTHYLRIQLCGRRRRWPMAAGQLRDLLMAFVDKRPEGLAPGIFKNPESG